MLEGRLVRVESGKVLTERTFDLLARLDALRRPAVVALRDWLTAAAE